MNRTLTICMSAVLSLKLMTNEMVFDLFLPK